METYSNLNKAVIKALDDTANNASLVTVDKILTHLTINGKLSEDIKGLILDFKNTIGNNSEVTTKEVVTEKKKRPPTGYNMFISKFIKDHKGSGYNNKEMMTMANAEWKKQKESMEISGGSSSD